MKRKGLLEGSSSGIEILGRVLCRVQRACRKLIEFFRWCISISPCMTPSKYRPWGFLEFKNIHRYVLQLQWLQTPGEFPQLGFHINIDSFFSLLLFPSQDGFQKYQVWTVSLCAHFPPMDGSPAVFFFPDTLALITLQKFAQHDALRIEKYTVWVKGTLQYYKSKQVRWVSL